MEIHLSPDETRVKQNAQARLYKTKYGGLVVCVYDISHFLNNAFVVFLIILYRILQI